MRLLWWVDGIHTGAKCEDAQGQYLQVIVGVTPEGKKERVAIAEGFRESKASRRDVLARVEGQRIAERATVGDRRWLDGVLGGAGGSVSGDCGAALLVPQDGQRVECLAGIAAGQSAGGHAGHLHGDHARRGRRGVRKIRRQVRREVSQGGGEAEAGCRQPGGVL